MPKYRIFDMSFRTSFLPSFPHDAPVVLCWCACTELFFSTHRLQTISKHTCLSSPYRVEIHCRSISNTGVVSNRIIARYSLSESLRNPFSFDIDYRYCIESNSRSISPIGIAPASRLSFDIDYRYKIELDYFDVAYRYRVDVNLSCDVRHYLQIRWRS